ENKTINNTLHVVVVAADVTHSLSNNNNNNKQNQPTHIGLMTPLMERSMEDCSHLSTTIQRNQSKRKKRCKNDSQSTTASSSSSTSSTLSHATIIFSSPSSLLSSTTNYSTSEVDSSRTPSLVVKNSSCSNNVAAPFAHTDEFSVIIDDPSSLYDEIDNISPSV
ncbi:unnamed protein product, partial [Schistosoma turkestanicum]